MRLIDADELECVYAILPQDTSEDYKEGYGDGMNYVLDIIDDLPTIGPVKHGRWKREVLGSTSGYGTTVMYQCSECERMAISGYNYCPNCGADMRGEEDEDI